MHLNRTGTARLGKIHNEKIKQELSKTKLRTGVVDPRRQLSVSRRGQVRFDPE